MQFMSNEPSIQENFVNIRRITPRGLAALACLSSGCFGSAEASPPPDVEVASVEQEFRTGWFGDGHEEITTTGLDFLKDSVLSKLVEENHGVDGPAVCDDTTWIDWFAPSCPRSKLRSEFHFDNCRMTESFAGLRSRYGRALAALNPQDLDEDEALHRFGQILHTTQDFYAHSNWADAHSSQLMDEGGFLPPEAPVGATVGDMVVLAQPLPAGWSVTRATGSRIPSVWDGRSWRNGLISGTYKDNVDASICTPRGSIPHGDFDSEGVSFEATSGGIEVAAQNADLDSYLAKDDPDSARHKQAVDLAVDQTTEEFCRLTRLVSLRYGQPARARLIKEWVGDRTGYDSACPHDESLVAAVLMAVL